MAPRTALDPDAAPWWEAINRDELKYQVCRDCQTPFFYPRTACPACLSDDLEWRSSLGNGAVYAFTVVRRAPEAAFVKHVPYVVALVDLDEGFRMMSGVVDCPVERVRVGLKVSLVFREGARGQRLPYFKPVEMIL